MPPSVDHCAYLLTTVMSRFRIPCCQQENCEGEKHYSGVSTEHESFGLHYIADVDVPVQFGGYKGMQDEYRFLPPVLGCRWDEPLQGKFSVLKDWATAIRLGHANGVVHGNLTPDAVDVVHGRGILLNQGLSPGDHMSASALLHEDLYGVRWAAAELFRIDNGSPRPTMMSDVYSFACLMLQMLTGKIPYCGTQRPEQVVYLKYLGREPIDTQTPEVADRYVAFMRWCWSSEPEKRPTMETVVGFIHDEVRWLGESRC